MKILIEIRGGFLVGVYSDTLEIVVEIIDWDEVKERGGDQESDKFTDMIDELEYQIF